jgi:D-aspartate ligase
LADLDRSAPVLLVKVGRYPLSQGGLGVIRSLGRVGVPVYAVTEDRFTPAALSRYLTGSFTWPTTGTEPVEKLAAGLREIVGRLGRRVIAVTTDDEAAVLMAEHGRELELLVRPAVPDALPRALASKRQVHELCERAGVPTAAAAFPASRQDVLAYAERGAFPVVAKNVAPFERLSAPVVAATTVVRTADDLVELSQSWPDRPNVMLQEELPVDEAEDWIFHMYCDAQSECLAAFTGVKLRSWPPRAGVTAAACSAPNEELEELSRSFCRAIGYRGIGDLDWRFDRRDGRYKLMDFNPRVGAQFRLFETDAGIDVVRALHLDLTGRPVPPGRQIDGRRFYVENSYAAALLTPRKRPARVPRLPRKLMKPELAWLAVDDPLPVLSQAIRFSWLVLRRLFPRGSVGARLASLPSAAVRQTPRPPQAATLCAPALRHSGIEAFRPVPILLYHAVTANPTRQLETFTVSPATFARQLDAIVETGAATMTVTQYLAARAAATLPERVVVITFDDAYADFYANALPALAERSLACTLYTATGFLEGRPSQRIARRPPDRMLSWEQLPELAAAGVEIGAHSHSHFHLDTLSRRSVRWELETCKALLEDALERPVPSFAYPNGHTSASVRRLVIDTGFESACGVRNALSWEHDDRYRLARLTVRSTTGDATFRAWLEGNSASVAPPDELLKTRAFRAYRRSRALVTRREGSDFQTLDTARI